MKTMKKFEIKYISAKFKAKGVFTCFAESEEKAKKLYNEKLGNGTFLSIEEKL